MAEKFGKTWWGEHWLRSLQNVDYGNRLPRGATYAQGGYVKEINIKKGNHFFHVLSGKNMKFLYLCRRIS